MKPKIELDYDPQPKQAMLHECFANEILYGGAAGPGKSHALRMEGFIWAQRIKGLQVYLFRRTYPELERNHILPILTQFGNELGNYKEQKRRFELYNGSMIHLCHAQYEKDIMIYHGAEIHLLLIDELTTFTDFMYSYLRNRLRCTLEIPPEFQHKIPGIVSASNPGGVGHEFCKRTFVDFCRLKASVAADHIKKDYPIYSHKPLSAGNTVYYGVRKAEDNEGGMLRCYIPGLLRDNEILMQRDPGYVNRVKAMPEPYRTSYLEGDWEIFIGQMFQFSRKFHVCAPHPVPDEAPLYMTFDWGFGRPFSVGWWYVDADGRVFRFSEWYGWNGAADQGMRMTDSKIAEEIIEHETRLKLRDESGLEGRVIHRLAGPDCFAKKPDYKGGGQGPSTADIFSEAGIIMSPGDPNRKLKVRQFHERLRIREDEAPMVQIFDICEHFIRTIPLLQQDENDVEDVSSKMEDHVYDEACHIFMARPLSLNLPMSKINSYAKRIDDLKKGQINTHEYYATIEQEKELRHFGMFESEFDAEDEYDDGALLPTM